MPPPLLERVALEFLRVLVLVLLVFVLIFGPLQTDNDLELQAQHAACRLNGADRDRAQQQHINQLKLVHLARRLRIDQHLNVRRPFQQLSAAVMLNAGLARRANFTRPP